MKYFILTLMLLASSMTCYSTVYSGSCGAKNSDVSYYLDTNEGTLTFSGNGAIKIYDYYVPVPWASDADKIHTIVLEEGITAIECPPNTSSDIFKSAVNTEKLSFPSSCDFPSDAQVFFYLNKLKEVVVAPGNKMMKSVDNAIFSADMTSLLLGPRVKEYTVPAGVKSVGRAAFINNTIINKVEFAPSVIEIGDYAFFSCDLLSDVSLPTGLKVMGSKAFSGTIIQTIDIPGTLEYIPDEAFHSAYSSLKNVILHEGLKIIGPYAFKWCEFRDIDFPSTLEKIEQGAFIGNAKLNNIYLPAGLKELGEGAFNGCYAMSKVYLAASVPPILGDNCFSGNNLLRGIYVPDESVKAYRNTPGWESLPVYSELPAKLTIVKNIRNGGTITGDTDGEYERGYYVSPIAKANTGYEFVGWYVDDSIFISDGSQSLNLKIVCDTVMMAKFVPLANDNDIIVQKPEASDDVITLSWMPVDDAIFYNVCVYVGEKDGKLIMDERVDSNGNIVKSRVNRLVSVEVKDISANESYFYSIGAIGDEGTLLSEFTGSFNLSGAGVHDIVSCDVSMRTVGGAFEIVNASGQVVRIYTLDGKMVYYSKITDNLHRIELESGVYVVKVDNQVFKVAI